jgi:phosphoserine phosphatase
MDHVATNPVPPPVAAAPSAERQVQDLHVILGVARAMSATHGLDELLTLILDSVRQVLAAERATLFLYDSGSRELYSKIAHGSSEIRFPADRGIAGCAVQERRTINLPDAYADPRFNRAVDQQTGYHTRCLLTVPLIGFDDQPVGALQVLNKVDGVFSSYDERLAEALAAQVAVALQRAQLMEHYVRKRQLEGSLALARCIQQNLLPREPPRIPGYELAGWCRPAEATGGDFYDFTPVRTGLAIMIADATGHGIGPALETAATRALFRSISSHVDPPSEILSQINRWLCGDLADGRFVTAFVGILDPQRHELHYASAGHGPLFWYSAGSRKVRATHATGLPLGVFDPLDIAPAPFVPFAPGDIGVLLTDGLIEACNPEGASFGQRRVADWIVQHAQASAADLVRLLEQAFQEFIGTSPQDDDVTAVSVKRCNEQPAGV